MELHLRHHPSCRLPTGCRIEKALVPHDGFMTGPPTGRVSSSSMSHTTLSFAEIRIAPTIPDLLRADQPKRRILRQPLGVVHIFVSRQPTVDGLSQQIGEW